MQIDVVLKMDSSSKRHTAIGKISTTTLLLHLIFLGLSLNLLHSPLQSSAIQADEAKNPLVYTRLRHDDNYLQLYRAYQLEHPHEEVEIQLKVNETINGGSDETRQVVYTYYKNKQVEANKITRDDLILEALDRTYKSRLIPAYLYNYDNPDDRRKASDPKLVSEPKCRRHLKYLGSKLSQKVSDPNGPELAAFFDSYAKEEPGLLFGNYHWTGNWRQCYKRRVFDISNPNEVIDFKGRYCIASIRSLNWEEKINLKTKELLDSGNYFKYPEQQYDYARFFRIQLGICLPESCDSQTFDTQAEIIRQLVVHKLHEPLRSYQLTDLYCLPDETSELRQLEPSAWLFILLALAWCSAIAMATFCDMQQQTTATTTTTAGSKSISEKLVSALSLVRNYQRLTETKSLQPPAPKPQESPAQAGAGHSKAASYSASKPTTESAVRLAPNDLLFLNAFKVISMPCILFGHTGMLKIMLNRFPLDYEALENDPLNHFNISSVFFVDWYFVITGFLASYLNFVTRKVERNTPFQWAYTMFHRYWRLAPMYILLFWFNRSLFQHTASGPVWDYGTSNMTLRSICRRESWLWPVALVPNLHPIHEECIMPAWYIANDMQYYILTPFILVSLSRWPIISWLATVGIICLSVLARIVRYMTDPRAQPLELMRPRYDAYMRNNWDMHATYIYPQYRISSYLVGLLAGHYAYMVLSGQWRSPLYKCQKPAGERPNSTNKKLHLGDTYRWLLRALVCLTGFHILISMMFASWVIYDLFPRAWEPHVKYFTALVYGTSHTMTSLGLSMICVTLMFGQFKWLRSFLSRPFFSLVSRLNYFVFLVQVEIIYWLNQSSERVGDLSPLEAFKNWVTLAGICFPMAIVFNLWLELPLANLEREFIGSWMASRARAASVKPAGSGSGAKLIANSSATANGSCGLSEVSSSDKAKKTNKRNKSANNCELTNMRSRQDAIGGSSVVAEGKLATRKQPEDSHLEVRIH